MVRGRRVWLEAGGCGQRQEGVVRGRRVVILPPSQVVTPPFLSTE